MQNTTARLDEMKDTMQQTVKANQQCNDKMESTRRALTQVAKMSLKLVAKVTTHVKRSTRDDSKLDDIVHFAETSCERLQQIYDDQLLPQESEEEDDDSEEDADRRDHSSSTGGSRGVIVTMIPTKAEALVVVAMVVLAVRMIVATVTINHPSLKSRIAVRVVMSHLLVKTKGGGSRRQNQPQFCTMMMMLVLRLV